MSLLGENVLKTGKRSRCMIFFSVKSSLVYLRIFRVSVCVFETGSPVARLLDDF